MNKQIGEMSDCCLTSTQFVNYIMA